MKTTEIKQKIQQLIDKTVKENEEQKKTLNFLFRKLDEIKELETIDRLRQFPDGDKFLQAYLTYKSISRANYQPEHTKLTNFWENEDGQDKLLEAINADIDNSFKEEPKPGIQPTNEQLLIMLGERIASGEIRGDKGCNSLYCIDTKGKSTTLELATGKLEPDPTEEFLKKHKLNK
jgi:hypothetical protein